MKKIFIFLFMLSVYIHLHAQTTKWVKDVFKYREEQKLVQLANFDNDYEIDGLVIKAGNLYFIRSYFTDKQDTLLITTGIDKDDSEIKTCDLNADGYLDILTLKYGGFIYSSTENKFKFLQLPFIADTKAKTLEIGHINKDSLPDIIINSSTLYLTKSDLSFQEKTLDNIKNSIYAFADLNNDGYDDLITGFNTRKDGGIFGSSGTDSLSLYYQLNKNGSFPDEPIHIYSDKSFLWDFKTIKIGNETHLALGTSNGLTLLHNSDLKFDVLVNDLHDKDSPFFKDNTYKTCYSIAVSDVDFDGISDLVYTNAIGIGWVKMSHKAYPESIKLIDTQPVNRIKAIISDNSRRQTNVFANYGDKIFKYNNISSGSSYYNSYKLGTLNPNTIQKFKSGDEEVFLYLSGNNLKYFKYSRRGDSLITDTARILLKNTFAYCLDTVTGNFPIIATINKSRNAFLIYKMDPLLTLTRTDSVVLSVFSYPTGISSFDYDDNSKPDILISSSKSVDLYKDALNYKTPVKVVGQRYSNSSFSKAYPIDFTTDGKDDFVTIEYVSSIWGNSYIIKFFDNSLKLIATYNAFGYTDKILVTDWDKDGKTDIISGADRLERYYFENDTIVKEQLSSTEDICDLAVYNKSDAQKNAISILEDGDPSTFYKLTSLNTDIPRIKSRKYINIELVQKSGSDSLIIILLSDKVATLVRLRASDLCTNSYQNLQPKDEFSGLNVYKSMFADYNLDRKKDIMMETNKGLLVFFNEGDLNFSAKPQTVIPHIGSYLIDDLDHDNDIDLIRQYGEDVYYYVNNNGTFRQSDYLSYSSVNELANFDDDDGYEVMEDDLIYDLSNQNQFIYSNEVSNRILKNRIYDPEYKMAANINGDKYTDYFIIRFDTNDTIFALASDGKKDFIHKPIFSGNEYYRMYVSDLNKDNYDDLVVVDYIRDTMYLIINQKDFTFKISQREKLYNGYLIPSFYDFDENGYTDIRFYNEELFLNTDGVFTLSKGTNLVPISDVYADVNDDKKDEFLFMEDGKISLYQWTKDEALKLTFDIKTIQIGIGQYLNYKLPADYILDENPDLINCSLHWDYFSNAPNLAFNYNDMSIRSYYLADIKGNYNFTLTFTDVLGNKVSDDFILEVVDDFVSKVDITNTGNLKCYPNPATDALYVKFPEGINNSGKISISNMEGKILYTENIQSCTSIIVPVANLPKGVYFLVFTNKNTKAIAKFIKQ